MSILGSIFGIFMDASFRDLSHNNAHAKYNSRYVEKGTPVIVSDAAFDSPLLGLSCEGFRWVKLNVRQFMKPISLSLCMDSCAFTCFCVCFRALVSILLFSFYATVCTPSPWFWSSKFAHLQLSPPKICFRRNIFFTRYICSTEIVFRICSFLPCIRKVRLSQKFVLLRWCGMEIWSFRAKRKRWKANLRSGWCLCCTLFSFHLFVILYLVGVEWQVCVFGLCAIARSYFCIEFTGCKGISQVFHCPVFSTLGQHECEMCSKKSSAHSWCVAGGAWWSYQPLFIVQILFLAALVSFLIPPSHSSV